MPIKRVRKTAGGEPMYGGIPLSRWIRDFREGGFETRIAAAEAIEAMGPETRGAVPALVGLLQGKETGLFPTACRTLGAIGKDASAKDPEEGIRFAAEDALGSLGKKR
jgi:hypothetical protein